MSLDHKTNLIVEFDETETILDSPSKPLYGSVTVPENLGAGDYKETFCVSCESISAGIQCISLKMDGIRAWEFLVACSLDEVIKLRLIKKFTLSRLTERGNLLSILQKVN
jgi:hypothetical protein